MLKTCLITLSLLFHMALAVPNYAAPWESGDFVDFPNCLEAPEGYAKSPISIIDSPCFSYENFILTMPNDVVSGAFANVMPIMDFMGAPYKRYDGATLIFNRYTYFSTGYMIRTKSEHILPIRGVPSDAEIQILMWGQMGNVFLSFLVREIPQDASGDIYRNSPYAKVMESITENNWQLNFKALADRITNHADYDSFLNMYAYDGTTTWLGCVAISWMVYGQELYASKEVLDIIRAHTADVAFAADGIEGNHNARPYTGAGGGGGELEVTNWCDEMDDSSAVIYKIAFVFYVIVCVIFI